MYKLVLISFTLFLFSCSSSRFVEPLARNQNAIAVDFGGPLVKIPGVATMPLPFTSITYGRGLTNSTTVYGSWFTTAAMFGVAQFDVGAVHELWRSQYKNMGLTANLSANFATDVFERNFKVWPTLEANFYWKYNMKGPTQADLLTNKRIKYNMFYSGIGSWFELSSTRAHGEKQLNRAFPVIQLGHSFRRRKWSYNLELKFMAPNISNQDIVLDYLSVSGKRGATGVFIGVIRRF